MAAVRTAAQREADGAAVLAWLWATGGGQTAFGIARALGWSVNSTIARPVNAGRARRTLGRLEQLGLAVSVRERCTTGGPEYRLIWHLAPGK
jgi:hypothetical protein